MHGHSYRNLALELILDFIIMYLVMYTMIATLDHFYFNVEKACGKLRVRTRVEAIAAALRQGLISLS